MMKNMFIDFHTHSPSPHEHIISLDPRFSNSCDSKFCYGAHPWYLDELNLDHVLDNIVMLTKDNNFVALGEIGLDRTIAYDFDKQVRAMVVQLKLARTQKIKNIIIHCVRAYSDLLEILKKVELKDHNIIIHDFNANEQIYIQLSNYNCFYSFGAKLLNKRTNAFKVFKYIDLNKVFFETDDQQKYSIQQIYEQGAKLKSLELQELKDTIQKNYKIIEIRP
jgi:TatD DNase family protein